MIIGISGKRGSGKDTLATALSLYDWERASFARSLKAKVRQDFNLTTEHTDGSLKEVVVDRFGVTSRQIMIDVGQFYRKYDPLFWVKKTFDGLYAGGKYTISDVRFINEADYIRSRGGILVRLNRDAELNIYKGEINDPSETQLDNYEFDVVIPACQNVTLDHIYRTALMLEEMYGHVPSH